jgi:hypothetical protein
MLSSLFFSESQQASLAFNGVTFHRDKVGTTILQPMRNFKLTHYRTAGCENFWAGKAFSTAMPNENGAAMRRRSACSFRSAQL